MEKEPIAVDLRLVLEAVDQRVVDSGLQWKSRLAWRGVMAVLANAGMGRK